MFRKILVFTIFNFLFSQGFCQTGCLNVDRGGSVPIFINALTRYQNGLTLLGWTKLRICLDDPSLTLTGWNLNFKANSANIQADGGSDPLDLRTIELRVDNIEVVNGSYTGTAFPTTEIALDNNYQTIISDTQITNVELIVTISYLVGVNATYSLMGKEPDFYFVDIEYNLVSTP